MANPTDRFVAPPRERPAICATRPRSKRGRALGWPSTSEPSTGKALTCCACRVARGFIAGGGGLRRFVQSPTVIAVLNSDLTYRQIFMDGRALEPDPLPIFMGYSVGRWDGDTLVVESNGFNEKTWPHAEGLSHTEKLRITERYRRTGLRAYGARRHVRRPGTFDSPLHAVVKLEYAADDVILERVCNEASEGGVKHWVGDKASDARTTAVEVPPGCPRQVRRHVSGILAR